MSLIQGNQVVLVGDETQRIPGLSLYLQCTSGGSNKDALIELMGPVTGASTDPRDYPTVKWDVFSSYGRIMKTPKERKRKQLFSGVTTEEAISKIRDEVLHSWKGYEVVDPPSWWVPLPVSDLPQVKVMLAKSIELANERELLTAKYDEDHYIVEMKYDGHRTKVHFHGKTKQARFDSRRQSDLTGLFSENTECVPHLANTAPDFIETFAGTILDGEITHPTGLSGVGSALGSAPEKAINFQTANGWVDLNIFDCLAVKGKWIIELPWMERRQYAEQIIALWKEAMGDWSKYVNIVPYWASSDRKKEIRQYVREQNLEGLILKDIRSPYVLGGRNWTWVKDKREELFDCVIMGHEMSQSEKYGPKGWIENIKIGQYKNGELVLVSSCGAMSEEIRQWLSENRARINGLVVEVEATERIKKSGMLRHPRFVRFRQDKNAHECTLGTEG